MHKLPNILRSKGEPDNEIWSVPRIKLEIFFLKYRTQKVVEELFPNPFLKNQSWAYFWINGANF